MSRFLARRHDWACEKIYGGYEIVLASGEIAYVTEASHPDLWLALKGGSNNFGIIRRFDVPIFSSDGIWYNLLEYDYNDSVLDAQAQSQAFGRFIELAQFDEGAIMSIFLDYLGGTHSIGDALWHAGNVTMPPTYSGFRHSQQGRCCDNCQRYRRRGRFRSQYPAHNLTVGSLVPGPHQVQCVDFTFSPYTQRLPARLVVPEPACQRLHGDLQALGERDQHRRRRGGTSSSSS